MDIGRARIVRLRFLPSRFSRRRGGLPGKQHVPRLAAAEYAAAAARRIGSRTRGQGCAERWRASGGERRGSKGTADCRRWIGCGGEDTGVVARAAPPGEDQVHAAEGHAAAISDLRTIPEGDDASTTATDGDRVNRARRHGDHAAAVRSAGAAPTDKITTATAAAPHLDEHVRDAG